MNYYHKVPLILLAAGESKRMGTPKQLLQYRERSLIRHAATTAIASICEPIIVVLGANSDRLTREIYDLSVDITYNSGWQQGMSTSIATGINTLLKMNVDLDAVVVALADQPLITHRVYNCLIESYYQNPVKAVACDYSDTIGVPALFDRTLLPKLLNMNHQGGAKQILNRYSERAFNLDLPEAAIDIDTPADYQKLLKINKQF